VIHGACAKGPDHSVYDGWIAQIAATDCRYRCNVMQISANGNRARESGFRPPPSNTG